MYMCLYMCFPFMGNLIHSKTKRRRNLQFCLLRRSWLYLAKGLFPKDNGSHQAQLHARSASRLPTDCLKSHMDHIKECLLDRSKSHPYQCNLTSNQKVGLPSPLQRNKGYLRQLKGINRSATRDTAVLQWLITLYRPIFLPPRKPKDWPESRWVGASGKPVFIHQTWDGDWQRQNTGWASPNGIRSTTNRCHFANANNRTNNAN